MGCCPHRREGPVTCGTLPSPSVISTPDRGLLLVVDQRSSGPGEWRRRNRGRKQRKPAATVERLSIVRSVAERTPPPPGRPSGHARTVRGGRAADARRHASGCSISASCRRRQWSSSTSSRLPVELGATTWSACLLHGLLPASPQGPRERRHARRPHTAEEDKARQTRLVVVANRRLAGAGPNRACRPKRESARRFWIRSHAR